MQYNKRTARERQYNLKNIQYHGLLRINVKKSTRLNRFLAGSAMAIAKGCPVV